MCEFTRGRGLDQPRDVHPVPDEGTLDARLDKLQAIGVKVVRYTLAWDEIAPTRPTQPTDPADPGYDWSRADTVLDGLHARGIDVVLQLRGTPKWANGG